jgi:hypothetical protein
MVVVVLPTPSLLIGNGVDNGGHAGISCRRPLWGEAGGIGKVIFGHHLFCWPSPIDPARRDGPCPPPSGNSPPWPAWPACSTSTPATRCSACCSPGCARARRTGAGGALPECSVLIVACNEAAVLPGKIRSILDGAHADRVRGNRGGVRRLHRRHRRRAGRAGRAAGAGGGAGDARGQTHRVQRMDPPAAPPRWWCSPTPRQHLSPNALGLLLANFARPHRGRGLRRAGIPRRLRRHHRRPGDRRPTGATRSSSAARRPPSAPFPAPPALSTPSGATPSAPSTPTPCWTTWPFPWASRGRGTAACSSRGPSPTTPPHQEAGKESVRKRRTIGGNLQLVRHDPHAAAPLAQPALVRVCVPQTLPPALALADAAAGRRRLGVARRSGGGGGCCCPWAGYFSAWSRPDGLCKRSGGAADCWASPSCSSH